MASVNEVKDKAFKVLTDPSNDEWDKLSLWTMAQDVFNDANNLDLESCCGNIVGITDSLTNSSKNIALSAKAVKYMQDQITALKNIKSLV